MLYTYLSLNGLECGGGNKIFPNDIFGDKIGPPRIYCSYKV